MLKADDLEEETPELLGATDGFGQFAWQGTLALISPGPAYFLPANRRIGFSDTE